MNQHWPTADLDPIRRLQVMAAVTPGTVLAERVIPEPFDRVWAVASDLEVELPHLIRDFRTVHVTAAADERLELRVRGYLGQRARFDVVLRPGWCWMQSRLLLGGMAAAAHPDGTRFAFLGGIRVPGIRIAQTVVERAGEPIANSVLERLALRIQPKCERAKNG